MMSKVATISIVFYEDETNTGYDSEFDFQVHSRRVRIDTVVAGFRRALKEFEERVENVSKPN